MTASTSSARFRGRSSPLLHLTALSGALAAAALITVTLLGGVLAPYRATELSGPSLSPPGQEHLLGTNALGQDVASQLILGARASVLVAVLAGAGTVVLGTLVGVAAGWFGGATESALMRFTDLVLVLPKLPLLLLVGALTGGSIGTLSVLLAATFWPMTARILRSQVRTLRPPRSRACGGGVRCCRLAGAATPYPSGALVADGRGVHPGRWPRRGAPGRSGLPRHRRSHGADVGRDDARRLGLHAAVRHVRLAVVAPPADRRHRRARRPDHLTRCSSSSPWTSPSCRCTFLTRSPSWTPRSSAAGPTRPAVRRVAQP